MKTVGDELPMTQRDNFEVRRRLTFAHDGTIGLRQGFRGDCTRVMVTHQSALLSRIQVDKGELYFALASGDVRAPRRFLLAMPPATVLPLRFERALLSTEGLAGPIALPIQLPAVLSDDGPCLSTLSSALHAATSPVLFTLDAEQAVSPQICRGRRLLHQLLGHPAPIRTVAKELGIAPETFTRQFAAAFRIGPKDYCHRARLFVGVISLLSGVGVLESALGSGFGDLSRFYVQFRRLLSTTPANYQVRKRQDPRPPTGR